MEDNPAFSIHWGVKVKIVWGYLHHLKIYEIPRTYPDHPFRFVFINFIYLQFFGINMYVVDFLFFVHISNVLISSTRAKDELIITQGLRPVIRLNTLY